MATVGVGTIPRVITSMPRLRKVAVTRCSHISPVTRESRPTIMTGFSPAFNDWPLGRESPLRFDSPANESPATACLASCRIHCPNAAAYCTKFCGSSPSPNVPRIPETDAINAIMQAAMGFRERLPRDSRSARPQKRNQTNDLDRQCMRDSAGRTGGT